MEKFLWMLTTLWLGVHYGIFSFYFITFLEGYVILRKEYFFWKKKNLNGRLKKTEFQFRQFQYFFAKISGIGPWFI